MRHRRLVHGVALAALFTVLATAGFAAAADATGRPASVTIDLGAGDPGQMSVVLQIVALLTVLSVAPAILIMMTSFIRVVVVLAFLRQAMGTLQTPPNQVLIGLALFLTFFIMSPVWQRVNVDALQPYLAKEVSQPQALERAAAPVREFMLRQVREKDLALFVDIARLPTPSDASAVPTHVVIPAFMISELRTSFQIGFLIYLPFLVIDLVVASVLMSMGMMMLPPAMVSLPFKLILFVLADGWYLVVGSLVKSFA